MMGTRRRAARARPLWTCPRCGERFVTANLWHSCGRQSMAALFARSEPHVRAIFDRLARLARACGPVRVYAQKTRAVIQSRIRFASAVPQRRRLVAGLLVPRGTASPRIARVLDPGARHYVVASVPLGSVADVDAEVRRLMRLAYRIGRQAHLSQ